MIFNTRGIVLRLVKYGESSGITTVFTERFGIQSYLVNGIRSQKNPKAYLYQPGSLVDMQVYHNAMKNLQRIKECSWSVVYDKLLSSVKTNAVSLYVTEMLLHTLREPEEHPELFSFCVAVYAHIDKADGNALANFPLYFSVHLARHLGFAIRNDFSEARPYFHLKEGCFFAERQPGNSADEAPLNIALSSMLSCRMEELDTLKLNGNIRRQLLTVMDKYFHWHLPDFVSLKTPEVLGKILN